MKSHTTIRLPLALALIALLSLVACQTEDEGPAVETEEVAISVEATVLEPTTIEIKRTYTGSLEGERQSEIFAQLSEAVKQVAVSEGQKVSADQVLFILDRKGSTSRYNEARSLYLNSEKTYEKTAYLYAEGAVSESEHDAAKTEYDVNKASFEAVSRLVEIRTPISGRVTSITVTEGEHVAPGQKIATVASTSRLKVRFGVNADEISDITLGSPVYISTDLTEEKTTGKILAVATSADILTRAFEVEALIDNTQSSFFPGMFVRIDYISDVLEDVLVIDQKSIITLDGQPTIYVISDGHAERRSISLGQSLKGQVVVTSGLVSGDTLVIVGQSYLDDGSSVNLTQLRESNR